MTLRAHIIHILEWWRHRHPSKALEAAIPAFREAVERERAALRRGDTRSIGRARLAKREAVNAALAGRR